jgi:hypothetical protein
MMLRDEKTRNEEEEHRRDKKPLLLNVRFLAYNCGTRFLEKRGI